MLSKIIDLILIVGGITIIVISSIPQGKKNISQIIGETNSYYTSGQIEFLALGIAMVMTGILVRIWRRNKGEK